MGSVGHLLGARRLAEGAPRRMGAHRMVTRMVTFSEGTGAGSTPVAGCETEFPRCLRASDCFEAIPWVSGFGLMDGTGYLDSNPRIGSMSFVSGDLVLVAIAEDKRGRKWRSARDGRRPHPASST